MFFDPKRTHNLVVVGSSPTRPTIEIRCPATEFRFQLKGGTVPLGRSRVDGPALPQLVDGACVQPVAELERPLAGIQDRSRFE